VVGSRFEVRVVELMLPFTTNHKPLTTNHV